MNAAEFHGSKVQIPLAVVDLFEADVFARDDMADIDPVVLPADAAIRADQADFKMPGVLERGERAGIRAWRSGETEAGVSSSRASWGRTWLYSSRNASKQYDPANLFRSNQNILPARGS